MQGTIIDDYFIRNEQIDVAGDTLSFSIWHQKLNFVRTQLNSSISTKENNDLIRTLFSHPGFIDIVTTYIHSIMNSMKNTISLHVHSVEWVVILLERLCSIRAQFSDEGIVITKGENDKLFTLRNKKRLLEPNNLHLSLKNFPKINEALRWPWKFWDYPQSDTLRSGKRTKKINKSDCSSFLLKSKLVFKTPVFNYKKQPKFDISKESKTVQSVFDKFRSTSESIIRNSTSMWRLSPTDHVVQILLDYCKVSSNKGSVQLSDEQVEDRFNERIRNIS